MSRTARIIVLATALTSLFTVMSSTANAVTWTNTGSTSIHATGNGVTLSVGNPSSGNNNLACTGSTLSATGAAAQIGDPYRVPGTMTFSPCPIAGGQQLFVHCGFTLTGTVFVEPSLTAGPTDVTCDVRFIAAPGTKLCHLEGTLPLSYTNPTAATSTPGRFTLLTSSSTLIVTNNGATSCWFSGGVTGNGPAHVSAQALTVTNVVGSPIITRHP